MHEIFEFRFVHFGGQWRNLCSIGAYGGMLVRHVSICLSGEYGEMLVRPFSICSIAAYGGTIAAYGGTMIRPVSICLIFFLGDWHSGLEHSSGGGMSGRLGSDESGSLGVFCHQYLERDWM